MNQSLIKHHPAHLLTGPEEATAQMALSWIKRNCCAQEGCDTCTTCRSIHAKQHPSLLWICPEKNYTKDQLEPVFKHLTFQADVLNPSYIVLAKADQMNSFCSNSLLKLLEEPPTGYYFILLAEAEHAILSTIKSRCITHQVSTTATPFIHPLFAYCTTKLAPEHLFAAHELIEQDAPTEQITITLFEAVWIYWKQEYEKSVQQYRERALVCEKMLAILAHKSVQLPMPGSSKLFWRTVILTLHAQELTKNTY
ncbi:MAG: hypothetical protein WCE21_00660 [Candidatus Babeliales bacterium]